MNDNLNQPITLPAFGQIVYQNSGVSNVFTQVPIQQTLTLPIPVLPTPVVQAIPIKLPNVLEYMKIQMKYINLLPILIHFFHMS